jgi:hypothetical protein
MLYRAEQQDGDRRFFRGLYRADNPHLVLAHVAASHGGGEIEVIEVDEPVVVDDTEIARILAVQRQRVDALAARLQRAAIGRISRGIADAEATLARLRVELAEELSRR